MSPCTLKPERATAFRHQTRLRALLERHARLEHLGRLPRVAVLDAVVEASLEVLVRILAGSRVLLADLREGLARNHILQARHRHALALRVPLLLGSLLRATRLLRQAPAERILDCRSLVRLVTLVHLQEGRRNLCQRFRKRLGAAGTVGRVFLLRRHSSGILSRALLHAAELARMAATDRRCRVTEEAKRKEEVRDNNLHRGDLDFFVYQAQSEA